MTEAQLAEIESRAKAATEGNMQLRPEGGGFNTAIEFRKRHPAVFNHNDRYVAGFGFSNGKNDGAFFVHARQDVLDLIAEVRQLQSVASTFANS